MVNHVGKLNEWKEDTYKDLTTAIETQRETDHIWQSRTA